MISGLHAGVASVDISPPPGVRLSGFAGRDPANLGARDELRASALYLEQGGVTAVLLTLDVIGLTRSDDARLRRAVAAHLGLPAGAVMAACSHTHAGPATLHIRATGAREPAWTREVIARAVRAAVLARAAATPVGAVRLGAHPCAAGVHRRERGPDGRIRMGADPYGPIDPDCRVLLLEGQSGRPLATLFQYGMHPVTLGRENRLASADWVSVARQGIENALGCTALFVQGCCGDINPRPPGADADARDDGAGNVEAAGSSVAAAALGALAGASALRGVRLGRGVAPLRLPLDPLCSEEALGRAEHDACSVLLRPDAALYERDLAAAEREWVRACRAERRIHGENGRATTLAHVRALSFGPEFTLVGLPGEPFTEIGLRLRAAVPGAWPVGYAAGNPGYLYPDAARMAGGYEVETAYKLYGLQPFGAGAADALHGAALVAARRAEATLTLS